MKKKILKLKDLLKESYVWERKFGEKLPTLASVQKKKLKEDLLTEKKELDSKHMGKLRGMTDRNNHTQARIFLAVALDNEKLRKFYVAMMDLNDALGGYGPELSKLNQKMEKVLYKELQRTFINAKDIISAL